MFHVSLLDKGLCEKLNGFIDGGAVRACIKITSPSLYLHIYIQAFGLVPSTHPSCVSS
jgi:hypothetical protein